MPEIPLGAIDRIIRKTNAERVSLSASEALREILEEQGLFIAQKAWKLVKHAGRKTITREDIELAAQMLQDKQPL
ncbi:MAG: histone family protein [Candidatus Hermodarchaeota archaeon]